MQRKLVPIRESRIKPLRQHYRESKRSSADLKALRDVQDQFDTLIDHIMEAKIMLAGITIADEVDFTSDY